MTVFINKHVIKVQQPLGTFYVASITARNLLKVCYSSPAELNSDGFNVNGTQRLQDEKRLHEIADYIETHEAAFPNAIILGANYDSSGFFIDDVAVAWSVKEDNGNYTLTIPTDNKIASIIDGQHRLNAFNYSKDEFLDIELLCAIYIDLPIPYHAFLFSTINFNQKKVDRSLAYNLFGFDIENSDPETWVPETLAVSIARRLNTEDTPFRGKITLGVVEHSERQADTFSISMATVVDGILKLISKKPKKDRAGLMRDVPAKRNRSNLDDDGSPLRFMYLSGYDEAIYETILNYFRCINVLLWAKADADSYITKTVGIQALFDVLAKVLDGFEDRLDGEYEDYTRKLNPISDLKFEDAQASGIGRANIKRKILAALGM